MQLSDIFCCCRARSPDAAGTGETDPLLQREPPPEQEIPTEDVENGGIIDVDADALRERLITVVVHKRGKMVDVGAVLPFSLSRPSSAGGRSASRRRSSRPSPLPRQWDPQYYSQHAHPSSPSHSRQPSPTPSMQTHTSPTRSSMYETGGLDGSLASLAGLPPPFEVDRGSLVERRQSNVHVRILDYGAVARGRRSRSRGGRIASGSTASGMEGEGKMAVSPVEEVDRHIEKEEEEDDDSVAGDLGGPDPETPQDQQPNPRQSSLSRERPSPDTEDEITLTHGAPLARSWGD